MLTPTNLSRLAAWAKLPATENLIDPTDPGADPQLVDDVWLARVIYKLLHETSVCIDLSKAIEYSIFVVSDTCKEGLGYHAYGNSATLALLRAARAAGVPEVVEAMGDES